MEKPTPIWATLYRLCPVCFRAVPVQSQERYCINDGTLLLEACPACQRPITSPYARFCGECGSEFGHEATELGRMS